MSIRQQTDEQTEGDPPEPVSRVLRREMAEQDLTFSALRTRTREHDPRGRGLSTTYLADLANAKQRPSAETLEVIATALKVDVWDITEYRLAFYRRLLDERPEPEGVGPELAAVALELVERVLRPVGPEEAAEILTEEAAAVLRRLHGEPERTETQGPARHRRAAGGRG